MSDVVAPPSSILIVGRNSPTESSPSAGPVRRGLLDGRDGTPPIEARDVALDRLKSNFDGTIVALHSLFSDAINNSFGSLALDSIEIHLEVTADGKFGILGTGVGVSGTTGLKLTFNRATVSSDRTRA